MALALIAIAAMTAASGGSAVQSVSCGDIEYTDRTPYGANERIVVNTYDDGPTLPAGVAIGGTSWSRTSYTIYSWYTTSTWKHSYLARGTYDVVVTFPNGFFCRNADGRMTIY